MFPNQASSSPSNASSLTKSFASGRSLARSFLWVALAFSGRVVRGVACWHAEQRGRRVAALMAHRKRIVACDAEALCLLAAHREGDDLLVYTRWCELLGREALSRRFYRVLEQRVRALADSLPVRLAADRAELALLCVSRLIFLSFLEAKGWLDDDRAFLSRRFDGCMARGGTFHERVLLHCSSAR